jgi:hypothetical protein
MNVDAAIALLLALLDNVQRISTVIAAAKADGRKDLTSGEWADIIAADDAARAALAAPASPPSADPAGREPV